MSTYYKYRYSSSILFFRATEIRNMLLYCILPMTRNLLDCDIMAHLGLFVAGIRVSQIKNNLKMSYCIVNFRNCCS